MGWRKEHIAKMPIERTMGILFYKKDHNEVKRLFTELKNIGLTEYRDIMIVPES